jgi:hypothetical protein
MSLTLSDLVATVDDYVITDADIDAMNKRLAASEAEFVQEMRDKTPSWDWYQQIVEI